MTNLGNRTVLLTCNPLFVSLAERLGREFGRVLLHVPHTANFPTLNAGRVGFGLPNVELVDGVFGDHFDDVDLFVFPDLGHGALQVHLEELGKRVWGGRHGEDLELYRELCKEEMTKRGLPVQPWKVLKGVSALRGHLKSTPKQHVKIDRWRGVTESFFSPSYEVVESKIDGLAHDLGAFKEHLEFIVEDDLPDRVEIGLDTFCIDGEYPEETLVGIEAKDVGYVGQVRPWSKIPEPLRRWNEKMADLFAKSGYRGNVSNEIRIGKDKEPFMIDATLRMPSPPSELMQELVENLPEIMWEGADGNVVEPKMAGTWGVEVIIRSAWAEKNHLPVIVPKEFERFVKFYNSVVVDGRRYVVPQDEEMSEIGAVIGFGDTLEDAIDLAREVGESIKGHGVKFSLGAVDQVKTEIAKIGEIGIEAFATEERAAGARKDLKLRSGKKLGISKLAPRNKKVRAKSK